MTVPKAPFHWDVALVQSIQTTGEPVQVLDATEPAVSRHPEQAPIPAYANRRIQHATSHAARVTSSEPKADTPVIPVFPPGIPPSAELPTEQSLAPKPDESTPTMSQPSDQSLQRTEPPVGSTTPAPPRPETAAPAPTLEGITPPTDIIQPPPAPPTASDFADVSVIRPDYGWLQQAISRRLEELKRSSRPSLDESRPLKVLIKAVVSREGLLLDSAVVKSSGLDRIDQEAIALVQRAFPMQFDRTLDRRQIVMRIPITYSRE
jgi:protein TonB